MFITSKRGFTLIELLIVIAIIGFLSSVVLIALESARIKARDARRISDIKQVQNALELYATNNNNTYPSTGTGYVSGLSGSLVPTYMPAMPTDPNRTASGQYRYSANASAPYTSYTILVNMEKDDPTSWCKVQMPLYTAGAGNTSWENTYAKCF